MTTKTKALGHALEVSSVKKATKRGLEASVQPGSGIYADFPKDIVLEELLGECKKRSTPPSLAQMEKWLEGADFLVYAHKGSREQLVLLRYDTFLDVLVATKTHRNLTHNGSR